MEGGGGGEGAYGCCSSEEAASLCAVTPGWAAGVSVVLYESM